MSRGLCVAGTGTDVGKTVVSAALCALLASRGVDVTYFKPVLSGASVEGGRAVPGDTRFVSERGGLDEPWERMTPFVYRHALSPHLAAEWEGCPFDEGIVLEAFRELASRHDRVVVEAAGGLAVPLDGEGLLMIDLLKKLGPPALLVGLAGVGTINHTVLSVEYARAKGLSIAGVLLNGGRGESCEADNVLQIRRLTGLPVFGPLPCMESMEGPALAAALNAVLPECFMDHAFGEVRT